MVAGVIPAATEMETTGIPLKAVTIIVTKATWTMTRMSMKTSTTKMMIMIQKPSMTMMITIPNQNMMKTMMKMIMIWSRNMMKMITMTMIRKMKAMATAVMAVIVVMTMNRIINRAAVHHKVAGELSVAGVRREAARVMEDLPREVTEVAIEGGGKVLHLWILINAGVLLHKADGHRKAAAREEWVTPAGTATAVPVVTLMGIIIQETAADNQIPAVFKTVVMAMTHHHTEIQDAATGIVA
jgi:hypothetical protein